MSLRQLAWYFPGRQRLQWDSIAHVLALIVNGRRRSGAPAVHPWTMHPFRDAPKRTSGLQLSGPEFIECLQSALGLTGKPAEVLPCRAAGPLTDRGVISGEIRE